MNLYLCNVMQLVIESATHYIKIAVHFVICFLFFVFFSLIETRHWNELNEMCQNRVCKCLCAVHFLVLFFLSHTHTHTKPWSQFGFIWQSRLLAAGQPGIWNNVKMYIVYVQCTPNSRQHYAITVIKLVGTPINNK